MAWAFESKIYLKNYVIASIVRGLCWTFIEALDLKYVEDLRTLRSN